MEDVATEYYRELLRRNLLQSDPLSYRNGGFTMHDLLRALAQFIAQGEYFSGEVATLARTSLASQEMKLRHLSISGDFLEISPEIVKEHTSVRTLIILGIPTNTLPEDLFQKLKCLRLLDLSKTNLMVVPESASSLVHLRYLDFSGSMISRLPETIGNLSNLQYLILQACEQLSELPKSIANLYKLRSIDLAGTRVIGIPAGIRQLIYLNRVINFVTNDQRIDGARKCYSSLEDLKPLINLRTITIVNLERAARAQGSILKDKIHIYHLKLSCSSEGWPYQQEDIARIQDVFEERLFPPSSVENFTIEGYFGMEFPTWMKNRDLFLNLTRLDILKCRNCSQLPLLGQLPLLDHLEIHGAWSIKHIGPEFMGSAGREAAFPKLKSLILEDMPEWEEWTWEAKDDARVMPVLESLWIERCPRLKSLPQGLVHHATNLSYIWIEESHSLTVIEGFKSVQKAYLARNNGFERLTDFPSVQVLEIEDCPALLHHVGVLPSLQMLIWRDSSMRFLPEWMLPHPVDPIFPNLQRMSITVGDVLTLKRCLINGPDSAKIQHIPNVYMEVMDRPDFISFTKEPFRFLYKSS
ncbi:hypothetical protein J5N97_015853 [Dioscorea zingiberensis]|uniref:Disease resistance R13L4/SHOC-2-like LRR domain-containing protein n=1 Tax=Dioscorea zingiberensis TaxID=325984 RepID=A0A9D5CIB2_9LILI|nr:hypothetical protein J5N97_015853 [Dioscorea zingiberensis]